MTIASEIVKNLELSGCLMTRTAESIIAAKLDPVRDVLSRLISMTAPDDCECMVCRDAKKVLALFEGS